MGRRTNDLLAELIKSLSSSEKRYFRLFAERHSSHNNYLKLFDAIAQQEVYDETKLKQQLADEHWLKNLAVVKSQLKQLVLESLVQFNRTSDDRSKLDHETKKAIELGQKGFKKEASDALEKIQTKAEKSLYWMQALTAVQWQKKFLYTGSIDVNRKLAEDEQRLLGFMSNEGEYYQLIRELIHIRFKTEVVRESETRQQLNELKTNSLLANFEEAKTLLSQYFYHTFHGIYHSLINETENSEKAYYRALVLLRENPDFAASRAEDYFMRLNSYVSKLSAAGLTNEFRDWLAELRKAPENAVFKTLTNVGELTTVYAANHELQAYFHAKNYDAGSNRAEQLFAEVTAAFPKVRDQWQLVFLYNGMVLHFMDGRYRESLKWIRAIEETPGTESELIRELAAMLHIMVRYELEDTELLESLLRSTDRSLKKEGRFFKIEQAMIEHYRNLLKTPKIDQQELWETLKVKFVTFKNDPSEKAFFAYFDFVEWINHRQ